MNKKFRAELNKFNLYNKIRNAVIRHVTCKEWKKIINLD